MLDHITIGAADFDRSSAFYDLALAPLGIGRIMEVTAEQSGGYYGIGYGIAGKPFFWIGSGPGDEPTRGQLHVAFAAADRPAVDAFYAAAIAAGGKDNGPPGVRAHYHPSYYGAFVLDPDGHNIEAVCHTPQCEDRAVMRPLAFGAGCRVSWAERTKDGVRPAKPG